MSDERMFPIQQERGAAPYPTRIPWSVADRAYSVYSAKYGRSQSLERLAERGGFAPSEMDMFLPGWREEASECVRLRAEVTLLTHKLITCSVAASHPDPDLSKRGKYGGPWDSPQAEYVRALRADRDALSARLDKAERLLRTIADSRNPGPCLICGFWKRAENAATMRIHADACPLIIFFKK